ncbi:MULTISPECIES: L,D-transpeptidase family protein [Pseudanabaena]|uniref:L,D-transpeptidase family protein n=1 Tax=Pseudanabaena TaxID=1152 RepID=UPI00247AF7D4|nr:MULTISPECIES: L,D-transpeptidase [Pseudanabaena]MEA5487726.1 L,D-transpeptidase [Pseudanabaena sp. CCNP1317]WGS70805.1 L,D-transpeptidase [Pseudanabaena galeata CCNP1313]
MSQQKTDDRRSLKLLKISIYLTLIASSLGIYAIANPNLANHLPCFTDCAARAANELLNQDKAIADLINLKKLDKKAIAIVVEKSKYKLTVYYQNKPIKSYAIVLGGNPKDDKLRQGDKRTPEGLFRVKELYYHSEWSKFILLDYPTQDSWRKFSQAKIRGEVTAKDSIGGEIGIHGVEKGQDWLIDRKINWTLGCVSLKNKDVEEIYSLLQRGTTIKILH